MNTYLLLMLEFAKTGLFAIGGGLATLPFLRDMTMRYPWFTMEDLLDMIAISESTPGPIGINMATFAGFNAAGILGGIVATLSLVFPSIIVVVIIASFMDRFRESVVIQRGFYLLRAATAGLIAGAIFEVVLLSLFDLSAYQATKELVTLVRWPALIIFMAFIFLIRKFPKVHPIVFIVVSACLGVVLKL